MARLGELERAIMDALWERAGGLTARGIADVLSARGRSLAATTVLTVLGRLEGKGLVARSRDSKAHVYRTKKSREAYVVSLMLEALGEAGDREAVLTRFAGRMSAEEADALRRALEGEERR